jgi:hypothetical protein
VIAFRDRRRTAWIRRIDVDAAVRMRDLAGLDVMAAVTDEAESDRLASDDKQASADLVDALYALFLPDAERLRVTDRQFGKRLRGVTTHELRMLFFGGLAEFFRMPGPEPEQKGSRIATAADLWEDVYRLAGEACVAPGPHTYGELAALANGRRRLEWAQTATLRADFINSNPYRCGPAMNPADLDPTGGLKDIGASGGVELTPDENGIDLLARFFMGAGNG